MTVMTAFLKIKETNAAKIRFDLQKLDDLTVMSALQATICGRFAPLATLVDDGADWDYMVTNFNKAVTYTAVELLDKQCRKRKL